MRKSLRIALGLIGFVVLLLAVGLVVLLNYDWNRARPWLSATVGQAIGRSVKIDGDLRLNWQRDPELRGWRAWIPGAHVSAAKISVGNVDWSKTPTFATLDGIDFDLDLLPLLFHRVSIPLLRFVAPAAGLERLADGRNNWSLPGDTQGPPPPAAWQLDLGRIKFDQGEFTLADAQNRLDLKIHVKALQTSIPFSDLVAQQNDISRGAAASRVGAAGAKQLAERADKHGQSLPAGADTAQHYAFSVILEGKLQNLPVEGSGKIGGVLALRNGDRPFPLHADVRIGDTRIAFVGTLVDPTDLDSLDLRLWLSGSTLADLYTILKITLPDSPPYATEGHLIGRFTPHDKKLRYEAFTARVGSSDLRGDLAYETKTPRPLLSGKVESDTLQFRDLAPLIGADQPAAKQQRDDATPQPAGKVLPVEPFRPERWQVMDADVQFTGDRVFRDAELPIHKLDTRIVMDNALLSLDPLRFKLAYGDVDAHLRFDGRSAPIKGSVKLSATGIQLARFLPKGEDAPKASLGTATAEAALQGSGNSVGSLLGAANGELKLILDRGTISKGLIETIGLNVPNILITKFFGDRQVDINCAAADFIATSGVYDARFFLIDTDIAAIEVTGTVNLGDEMLDLVIHPNSKSLRLFSLRSPIHVKGSFKQPDIGIDKGALFARGAGAVALGVIAAPLAALLPLTAANIGKNDDDRCAPMLKALQQPPPKPQAPSAPVGKK